MVQPEPAAQLQPRAEVEVLPDAAAPQPEAEAQYEQASPLLWGPQPERRVGAAPALEQRRERVQTALLPATAEPRQVWPKLAALPGEVAAEPQPLPSSA